MTGKCLGYSGCCMEIPCPHGAHTLVGEADSETLCSEIECVRIGGVEYRGGS